MLVMMCTAQFVPFGIALPLLLLIVSSTSDAQGNIYKRYYIEDSCSSDDEVEYHLEATGSASAAEFSAARNSFQHRSNSSVVINCRIKIVTPPRYGVLLTASHVSYQTTSDSCRSFIEVYEYKKPIKICWNRKLKKTFFTTVGNMTIVYQLNRIDFENSDEHDGGRAQRSGDKISREISGIKLTATAFHRVYPRCNEDEFQCRHIRCIWEGFACDNINNCGDGLDERNYEPSNCRRTVSSTTLSPYDVTVIYSYNQHSKVITEVAISSALLIIFAAAFRFFCYYRCLSARNRRESMAGIGVIGETHTLQTPFQASAPPYTAVANGNCTMSGEIPFPTAAEPPSYSVAVAQAPPLIQEQEFLRARNEDFSRNDNQPLVDNLSEPPPYHAVYDVSKH